MKELAGARFFVLPSHWFEGFPIAVLETMAAGVPTLATDHGSLASIVNEDSGGLVFPLRNADALANAALRLWNDADLNERLSNNAAATFKGQFDAKEGVERLLGLYEETIESAARGTDQ